MKYSDNYQFNLPEKTDSADVDFLSANFSVIDTILKNHNVLIGKKVEVLAENAVTLESAPSQIPTGVSFCFVKTKKFVNGIYEEGWLMNYSSENENALYKTIQVWYGSLLNKPLQRKSKKQADLTHIWGEWEEYAMSSDVQEVRSEIQKHIALVNDSTSRLDKRITNIEQGITPSPFETDNTVAYRKIVPENALPYAEISKVGGMTRKCENLIPTQTSYRGLCSASITEVESLGLTDLISTLPIPESVQALEGYGWGINESAYNYVDFEKKQFVQNVGKVELDGTEQWLLHTATNVNQFYTTSFVDVKSSGGGSIRTLCSHYKDISVDNRGGNFGTCYSVSNGGIAFNINDIEGVTAWKAHLAEQFSNGTPVTVVYELTTPIITDISDILFDDNYIAVEGGGTVLMINEFEYAVPSEITYQIKGDS